MTGREPAWRVLASELALSTVQRRGEGDRAASYLLSPWGARMSRVLVVGRLAPAESIGRDPAQPFVRSRLDDPTGTVSVTAGGFQPRALQSLREVTEPRWSLVVGKPHLFTGRDAVAYISVRAEGVCALDPAAYRWHLLDAVRQTVDRVELVHSLRRTGGSGDAAAAGRWSRRWRQAAAEVVAGYPEPDLIALRERLLAAVSATESEEPEVPPSPVRRATVTRHSPAAPAPPPSVAGRAQESVFLDIVDELCDVSADGYADLKEAYARISARGVPEPAAEEILNRLEESGAIEEPIVGKLRRA